MGTAGAPARIVIPATSAEIVRIDIDHLSLGSAFPFNVLCHLCTKLDFSLSKTRHPRAAGTDRVFWPPPSCFTPHLLLSCCVTVIRILRWAAHRISHSTSSRHIRSRRARLCEYQVRCKVSPLPSRSTSTCPKISVKLALWWCVSRIPDCHPSRRRTRSIRRLPRVDSRRNLAGLPLNDCDRIDDYHGCVGRAETAKRREDETKVR
jgi:hypothetical protein